MTLAFDPRSDEALSRHLDGELTSAERAQVDAALAADPALAARLRSLQSLRPLARDAFHLAPDPRDRDLERLIRAAAPSQARTHRFGLGRLGGLFAPRNLAAWGATAAAAFVAGLVVAPTIVRSPSEALIGADGRLTDAALVQVLDRRLATQGADDQGRGVGLTFQDADGRWCRTFTASRTLAGLACRAPEAGDGWTLKALAPLDVQAGEIRTASTALPDAVLAAVDATLAGETLDAAAETRARDAGWR